MNDRKSAVTNIEGAAAYMAVPTEIICDLIDSGELPTTRIGSFIRFRYSDLDDFLQRKTTRSRKVLDPELCEEMCVLIQAWNRMWGSKPVRATDLNNLCRREELLQDRRGDKSERSQVIRLGRMLGAIIGIDFDGLSVTSVNDRKGKLYCLESNSTSSSTNRSQSEIHPADSEPGQVGKTEKTSC